MLVHSVQKTATQHKALTSVMAVSTQRRGIDPAALTLRRHYTTRPRIKVASQLTYSPAVRAGRRHSRVIRGAVYGCRRSRRSRPLPPQHCPLPPQPQQSSSPSPPAACPCAHAPRRARDWQHPHANDRHILMIASHVPLSRPAQPAGCAPASSRTPGCSPRLTQGRHAMLPTRRHGTGALGERLAHVVVLLPQQLEAAPLVRRRLALAVLGAPGAPAAGAGFLAHAAPRGRPRAIVPPAAVPRARAPARAAAASHGMLTGRWSAGPWLAQRYQRKLHACSRRLVPRPGVRVTGCQKCRQGHRAGAWSHADGSGQAKLCPTATAGAESSIRHC